jgi:hypothetical protein
LVRTARARDVRVEERAGVPGDGGAFADSGWVVAGQAHPGFRGDGAEALQEREQAGAQQQREERLRDQDAREQEGARAGEDGERRIVARPRAEGLVGPAVPEQHQQQHGQRLRQVRGEGIEAEEPEADRRQPVGQRSFFEVAHAVDLQRHQIAGGGHRARGLRVGGVCVVEDGRAEKRGEEQQEPQPEQDRRYVAGARTAGEGGRQEREVRLGGRLNRQGRLLVSQLTA